MKPTHVLHEKQGMLTREASPEKPLFLPSDPTIGPEVLFLL